MNPKIEAEIKKFEALQEKYTDVGAQDSEPSAVFQMVIAHAITKESIDFSASIPWELLYDEEEDDASLGEIFKAANEEMNKQAHQVYTTVQSLATPEDEQELRKYCWRLDDEEFLSWEQVNALNPPFKK